MEPIHFFKAGTHVSNDRRRITFTEADIRSIAASYDPAIHEAPIVIGHPKTDDPAFGWVGSLEARADGFYANTRQVNAEFAQSVRDGAFKKVSGSFYTPDTKGNPKPGGFYLRHIGFLGAAAPAVKGLQQVAFSDEGGVLEFEEGMSDLRELVLREQARHFARANVEFRLKELANQARIHFSDIPALTAFVESLDERATISFADPEEGQLIETGGKEWFMGFLSNRAPFLPLGEFCKGEDFSETDSVFAAPAGHRVDPTSADLHRRALHFQRSNGGSYADAVRAVERR